MIIDTPDNVSMKVTALKAAGVTTVIRYLNPLGRTSKVVTSTEAHAIATAGMKMGLVSEGWGDFAHSAINATTGARDAKSAFAYAPTVGAAPGMGTIYFAVDTDASDSQIQTDVIPYFRAIQSVNAQKWSIGVYGCGAICTALKAAGLVDKTWLANAMGWNGSKAYSQTGSWVLQQHLPTHIAGVDVDVNDGRGDIGDFVPFAPAPAVPASQSTTPDISAWITSEVQRLEAYIASLEAPTPAAIVTPPPTPAPAPKATVQLSSAQLIAIVQATALAFADSYIQQNVPSMFSGMAESDVNKVLPSLAQAIVAALLKKGKFVNA